jgi:hypothetical protein
LYVASEFRQSQCLLSSRAFIRLSPERSFVEHRSNEADVGLSDRKERKLGHVGESAIQRAGVTSPQISESGLEGVQEGGRGRWWAVWRLGRSRGAALAVCRGAGSAEELGSARLWGCPDRGDRCRRVVWHEAIGMRLGWSAGQPKPVRSMVRQAENIRSRQGW